MVGVELLDPHHDLRWARFVDASPGASIFHHPEWIGLLHRTYGYPLAACCVIRDGRVQAGLPVARVESRLTGRRLVSLPFSDLCVPVVAPGAVGAREALMRGLGDLREREGLDLEIRAPAEDLPDGHPTGRFLHHRLALSGDAADHERAASGSTRRGVKKARKAGLVVERSTDERALGEFYRLHLRTRRRQGVPIQPKRFILGLRRLYDAGLGFTALVRDGELVVAAAVFLHHNGVLTYKYGASDERHLAARPNNLLFMATIAWAAANTVHTLDFGRTDADNAGLAAFKRGWGAEERTLTYTTTGGSAGDASHGRGAEVLKALIQRGPPGMARLTGEVLYKHVG